MGTCFISQQTKHKHENIEIKTHNIPTELPTIKYQTVAKTQQLVYRYCVNIKDNIPLEIVEIIFNYYSLSKIATDPVAILYDKIEPNIYTFEHINVSVECKVQQQIDHDQDMKTTQCKILLLGGRNKSGTTTIYNQLRYIHHGLYESDLQHVKTCISE
eukprot:305939_1